MSNPTTAEPNPFIGTPPAAMAVIEQLLVFLANSDEHIAVPAAFFSLTCGKAHSELVEKYKEKFVSETIDQYREARGEDGVSPWYWMHGGTDDDDIENGFWGDFATRDEALQSGLVEANGGGISSDDGKFKIAECRRYQDLIDPEYSCLADCRHEETIDLRDHGIEPIAPTEVKADEVP